MKMRVKLVQLDQPNANNRVYPTEAIKEAIAKAPDSLLGTIGLAKSVELELGEVAMAANQFKIIDGYLTAEITILETPAGKAAKELIENDSVAFRPVGYGNVAEDGTVSNYTFHSISMIPKGDAA
jgi:hypothetical protein